jgi:hypothetical protein
MFRLALTALVLYVLWTLLKWVFAGSAKKTAHAESPGKLPAAEMVACSACGTFAVKAESVEQHGKWFCSKTCSHNA